MAGLILIVSTSCDRKAGRAEAKAAVVFMEETARSCSDTLHEMRQLYISETNYGMSENRRFPARLATRFAVEGAQAAVNIEIAAELVEEVREKSPPEVAGLVEGISMVHAAVCRLAAEPRGDYDRFMAGSDQLPEYFDRFHRRWVRGRFEISPQERDKLLTPLLQMALERRLDGALGSPS
jgi:hypothetical protein